MKKSMKTIMLFCFTFFLLISCNNGQTEGKKQGSNLVDNEPYITAPSRDVDEAQTISITTNLGEE